MNKLCKKTITFSIILLLIGVSVSSAISIDTKSTIVKSEEDCNCKEIDSRQLVVLEKQLNRLEVYIKLLLVLSKYNPELKGISEELSNEITTLKEDFPIICAILDSILTTLYNIREKVFEMSERYLVLGILLLPIAGVLTFFALYFASLWFVFCY